MNENIDLTKILDGCPVGTVFYSPLFGEITRHCSELEITKDEYGRTVYRNVSSLYVVNADYPFLSYRDISGSLSLTSEEISNKKILVLDLTSDVTLADDETKADVEERKKEVLQKER